MTAARDHVRKHGKPDDAIVQEIVRRVVEWAEDQIQRRDQLPN